MRNSSVRLPLDIVGSDAAVITVSGVGVSGSTASRSPDWATCFAAGEDGASGVRCLRVNGAETHARSGLGRKPSWFPSVCSQSEQSRWATKRVRRETGKEQVVQVHYDEGVAIHIGPEPCVGVLDADEASVGEGIGQPLSRESGLNSGADAVLLAEGNTERRAIASARTTRRGRRP